jgi:tetratricopeptide (TPR) repeat protein
VKRDLFSLLLLFAACVAPVSAAYAQAADPQAALNRYVADLRKNPGDNALREKIIRHVQTMSPSPAIPEEAERHMARGAAAVKNAKNATDFRDAVNEFEKATLAAPWLASAYYNLGIARDKADMYADAIQSLKLYLLAAPEASDAKAVKNLIYEMEYKQEKAAKESSPEVAAVRKQNTYEEWLRGLDGARFFGPSNRGNDLRYENEFVIRGTTITWRQRVTYYGPNVVREAPIGQWYDMAPWGGRMQIIGREAKRLIGGMQFVNDIFTISEDGKSITQAVQAGSRPTFTYYRQ